MYTSFKVAIHKYYIILLSFFQYPQSKGLVSSVGLSMMCYKINLKNFTVIKESFNIVIRRFPV